MKKIAYIFVLLFVAIAAKAQKVVRFVDNDLDAPIAYVLVADKDSVIAKANEYGAVFIPHRNGKIIFVHDAYERIEMDYKDVPEVLVMQRRTYDVDEVVVVGQGKNRIDKHAAQIERNRIDRELQQAGAGNGNMLGWLNKILFGGKSKRERHKEHVEKVLEEVDK